MLLNQWMAHIRRLCIQSVSHAFLAVSKIPTRHSGHICESYLSALALEYSSCVRRGHSLSFLQRNSRVAIQTPVHAFLQRHRSCLPSGVSQPQTSDTPKKSDMLPSWALYLCNFKSDLSPFQPTHPSTPPNISFHAPTAFKPSPVLSCDAVALISGAGVVQ